jgi:hypothetical protein
MRGPTAAQDHKGQAVALDLVVHPAGEDGADDPSEGGDSEHQPLDSAEGAHAEHLGLEGGPHGDDAAEAQAEQGQNEEYLPSLVDGGEQEHGQGEDGVGPGHDEPLVDEVGQVAEPEAAGEAHERHRRDGGGGRSLRQADAACEEGDLVDDYGHAAQVA